MRIDEFSKYKRIVESNSTELLNDNPEAMKVYKWMEETGRIDEGFFGAIWNWLKRNFSPTARRIYKLADEFGKELKKEMEAEFGRKADVKDMAAQMRSSWAGRISGDIREKMDIEAGDDEDYRELVRVLVNKKTLEGKKEMLKYLDKGDARIFSKQIAKEQAENDAAEERIAKNSTATEREKMDSIRKDLSEKTEKSDTKSVLRLAFPDRSALDKFLGNLIGFLLFSSKKSSSVKLDSKTAEMYLIKIVEDTKRNSSAISGKSQDEAIKEILNQINKKLQDTSNVVDINKLITEAIEKAKKSSSSEKETGTSDDSNDPGDEAKSDLTSSHTTDIITGSEVDKGIDAAKDATGKSNPTAEDILDKVNRYIEKQFESDENIEFFAQKLNKEINKFNNLSDKERKTIADNRNFQLDKLNKMKSATNSDVKKLLDNFVQIAGEIVPYFLKKGLPDDDVRYAKTILSFIFEIYAVKKTVSNTISGSDATIIVNNIREQNKEEYK